MGNSIKHVADEKVNRAEMERETERGAAGQAGVYMFVRKNIEHVEPVCE